MNLIYRPSWRPAAYALALATLFAGPLQAAGQEEEGHMHGPDGRHIAVPGSGGGASGQILSHHDLKITDTRKKGSDGKEEVVKGCEVHSVLHRKGRPQDVVHREANVFEPENGVYGSHMAYKEPGEYVLVERVVFPNKKEVVVEFPIWVPGASGPHEDQQNSPLLYVIGVGGVLAVAAGAYALGRRSGRRAAPHLGFLLWSVPVLCSGLLFTAADAQEEEGHMHGPDGRHIAVPGGGSGGGPQLRAYPSLDNRESAEVVREPYRFTLSIENEELKPDPNLIILTPEAEQSIGLTIVEATEQSSAGGLATTGQVRPNPNGFVTANAPAAGRIVHVGVTPGQEIPSGHVIAVLDSAEIADAQGAYTRAEAEVQQAVAARRRFSARAQEADAEVVRAEAELSAASGKAERLRQALARQRQLASAGAFSEGPVESARTATTAAEGELRTARSALANLEASARRLDQGLKDGVVARKEVEAAHSLVEQGRTRVITAERQLEIAQAVLAREERIRGQGLRNSREVQQAESDYEAARQAVSTAQASLTAEKRAALAVRSGVAEADAEIRRARGSLAAALQRLRVLHVRPGGGSRISVVAQLGGEVEQRPVNSGEVVSAGQVIATILNTDTVWVESDIFERDLPRVRVGQRVTVAADAVSGRTFAGTVDYLGAEVNPTTRAVRVRTVVPNRGELLKPNMFVRAMIGTKGGDPAVTVPAEAVQESGAERVVFVAEEKGQFRMRPVRVGPSLGKLIVIESGVLPGEKLVAAGAYQLLAKAKGG